MKNVPRYLSYAAVGLLPIQYLWLCNFLVNFAPGQIRPYTVEFQNHMIFLALISFCFSTGYFSFLIGRKLYLKRPLAIFCLVFAVIPLLWFFYGRFIS